MKINLILVLICLTPFTLADRVDPYAACSRIGDYYAKGCTGLTADLLGMRYKTTAGYSYGNAIGDTLVPGTIVGWPRPRPNVYGHVTVFIGQGACACDFVDVNGPGNYARCKNGGYGRTLYYAYY